jgi:hypothetical protein
VSRSTSKSGTVFLADASSMVLVGAALVAMVWRCYTPANFGAHVGRNSGVAALRQSGFAHNNFAKHRRLSGGVDVERTQALEGLDSSASQTGLRSSGATQVALGH